MTKEHSPAPNGIKEARLTRPTAVRLLSLFGLSFVAGYVDLVVFTSAGIFTGHITSNLTVAGSAIARRPVGHWVASILVLPLFVVAVAIASALADRAHRHARSALFPLLVAEAAVLLGLLLAGFAVEWAGGATTWGKALIIGLGVVAMAIQNVTSELETPVGTTTAMTVNLTRFTRSLVNWLWPGSRGVDRQDLTQRAYALSGFVAGAAVGTLLFWSWRYWSLTVPFLLSLAAAAMAWRWTSEGT